MQMPWLLSLAYLLAWTCLCDSLQLAHLAKPGSSGLQQHPGQIPAASFSRYSSALIMRTSSLEVFYHITFNTVAGLIENPENPLDGGGEIG